MNAVPVNATELDLHRLDAPYAQTRVQRPEQVRRLMTSIDADGQRVPLVVVNDGERFGLGRRLPALGGAAAPRPRHRPSRGVAGPARRGPDAGVGPPPGPRLRAHRAGLDVVGGPGRGAKPARPGRGPGQGRQLGQPASGAARAVVRALAGGAAPRRALDLGGKPGVRAVGARQRRRCAGVARGPAQRAPVHARVGHLVCPLWAGQPHCPRAHGGPAAAVHPGPAGA